MPGIGLPAVPIRIAPGGLPVAGPEVSDMPHTSETAIPAASMNSRISGAIGAAPTTASRLGSDRRLQDSVERVIESGARALADQFHDDFAGLTDLRSCSGARRAPRHSEERAHRLSECRGARRAPLPERRSGRPAEASWN